MSRHVYCIFTYTDRGLTTDTADLHEIFIDEEDARREAALLVRDLGGEWTQQEDFSWTQDNRTVFVERRLLS